MVLVVDGRCPCVLGKQQTFKGMNADMPLILCPVAPAGQYNFRAQETDTAPDWCPLVDGEVVIRSTDKWLEGRERAADGGTSV